MELEEWIQRHQHSVSLTQEHVRGRVADQALRRNQGNNEMVNDAGFLEGQRILLRNRVHGRNKIQDHWGANVYKVLRRSGPVYTVCPVDGGPSRQVHRTEMRAVPDGWPSGEECDQRSGQPTGTSVTADADQVDEEDPAVLVVCGGMNPQGSIPLSPTASGVEELSDELRPAVEPPAARRTTRATAGHHSNPHHLPRGTVTVQEEGGQGEGPQ